MIRKILVFIPKCATISTFLIFTPFMTYSYSLTKWVIWLKSFVVMLIIAITLGNISEHSLCTICESKFIICITSCYPHNLMLLYYTYLNKQRFRSLICCGLDRALVGSKAATCTQQIPGVSEHMHWMDQTSTHSPVYPCTHPSMQFHAIRNSNYLEDTVKQVR